jgi:hypothetical protein
MKKALVVLSACTLIAACGGSESSDGSKASTYNSCAITETYAFSPSDRTTDLQQCWDGVDYKDLKLALYWCQQKVSAYIDSRYPFGNSVEFEVASTNCP